MKIKILVFSLLLIMSACARLEWGVSYFSYFAKSEVEEMFDMDTPQKKFFEKKLEGQIDKIKKEQFPKYADYLEKVSKVYQENSMTSVKAAQLFEEGEKIFLELGSHWKNAVTEVVMELKEDQFKNFEKYFFEKLKKDKEKLKTEKDRQKKQAKTMERWIDQTIEVLTPPQEEKLEQLIKTNPRPKELSWKSQEHVFQIFKEAFPIPEKRKQFLNDFLTDWRKLQLPEYIKAREIYMEKMKDFVIDLSVNLNEKQKKNLIENLNKRAAELRKLAH